MKLPVILAVLPRLTGGYIYVLFRFRYHCATPEATEHAVFFSTPTHLATLGADVIWRERIRFAGNFAGEKISRCAVFETTFNFTVNSIEHFSPRLF
jgi:hypothetical protein